MNAIANMAFLDWPENAEISADDPMDYWPEMTERLAADKLDKQRYWHALPVGWEQLEYTTFLERRRSLIAQVTRDGFARLWDDAAPAEVPDELAELIALGESQALEFKSTGRWNVRGEVLDKKMEHVILKTVCGFLNAEGGRLLIGVDDHGNVLGLDEDMATLGPKGDRDGYELWLRSHLDANLSISTAGLVKIRFEDSGGKDVCIVSVASAGKAVFAKPLEGKGSGPTEFWVRNGNKTEQLHADDMTDYMTLHWGT